MIPRLRPWIGAPEILAALGLRRASREDYEGAFARRFGTRHAVSFGYGRAGLYLLLKALGLRDREVVIPAYTCVVVAHAIVKSGNIPVFVDCNLRDYTMDLERLEAAVTPRTAMVIPTHLYGYAMDTRRVAEIVRRKAPGAVVVQDCAHSFGAEDGDGPVTAAPDCSLFGLNISKVMTAIFGGMIATSDDGLREKLLRQRERDEVPAPPGKGLRRALYLLAATAAFTTPFVDALVLLETRTRLLAGLTDYYRDDVIDLPADVLEAPSAVEAAVGMAQLERYPRIIEARRRLARLYDAALGEPAGAVKPPLVGGATYSHYAIRLPERDKAVASLLRRGVRAARVIEYSVPDMAAYRPYRTGDYPNSTLCSSSMLNLPMHPQLSAEQAMRAALALMSHLGSV